MLVTGAGGFAGRHLCTHILADPSAFVTGTLRGPTADGPPAGPRLRFVHVDLRRPEPVQSLIDEVQPDQVYHLAAESSVPASYADPWHTIENNVRAEINVLEAVRQRRPSARVLAVGSNEEYGPPLQDCLPLTEESPLRPANPYGVSKVAQDLLGLQYHLAYELEVVRVRPFNHTGPGQSERFVVPEFAKQIALIEAGLQEPVISVGNLAARRDFSDVRDIVRGYRLALAHGKAGDVYNLSSGRSRTIGGILDSLLDLAQVRVQVRVDPARCRPVDVADVYGSSAKLQAEAGWEPRVAFEETLSDTLDYWRKRVRT